LVQVFDLPAGGISKLLQIKAFAFGAQRFRRWSTAGLRLEMIVC